MKYNTSSKRVGDGALDVPKKEVENMAIRVITEQEINEQKEYIQKLTTFASNKKYYLMTMGCQLNESESEKISSTRFFNVSKSRCLFIKNNES